MEHLTKVNLAMITLPQSLQAEHCMRGRWRREGEVQSCLLSHSFNQLSQASYSSFAFPKERLSYLHMHEIIMYRPWLLPWQQDTPMLWYSLLIPQYFLCSWVCMCVCGQKEKWHEVRCIYFYIFFTSPQEGGVQLPGWSHAVRCPVRSQMRVAWAAVSVTPPATVPGTAVTTLSSYALLQVTIKWLYHLATMSLDISFVLS